MTDAIGDTLPTSIRNRLLRRALSFQPDAAVANGDEGGRRATDLLGERLRDRSGRSVADAT